MKRKMAKIFKIFLFTLLAVCTKTYALTIDEIKNNLVKESETEVLYLQEKITVKCLRYHLF